MASDCIGVLVAQLGTPDAPTAQALRPYLRQFLSDQRVIDYPAWVWQPILRGIILRTRPARSARLYARIWMPEGSPLRVYSDAQIAGLQARLGDRYRVVLGMTYGNPSIESAMAALESAGINRIVVLSMFPQYSSTTSAPIYDAVSDAAGHRNHRLSLNRKRTHPALRFVEPFYTHPGYIEAMRCHLLREIAAMGAPPDVILITFHGIPARYVRAGDPYRAQCEETARLLADAMDWRDDQWRIGFQSRFGPENWLEPYTDQVIEALAREGKRILVFSPGFITDCLETLDELGNEGAEAYRHAGGPENGFRLAPCLNANPDWLDTLANIVRDDQWRTS
jgi:ferrochelatase